MKRANSIDIVVTWVDNHDKKWLEEKNKYSDNHNKILNDESRYRDWGIFKYVFRSIEKNAKWVNKVFLITEGHLPEWINLECEKLIHVRHSDYIDNTVLPTFNSNVIELNIGNIDKLSENFVLFNDDIFIVKETTADDFFVNNIPRDTGIFSPIVPKKSGISSIVQNNLEIINMHFDSRQVIKNSFFKYFNLRYREQLIKNFCVLPWKPILGFYDSHLPVSYNKSLYKTVLEMNSEEFNTVNHQKFRSKVDINHWLIRYWNLASGNFVPRDISFGKYLSLDISISDLRSSLTKNKSKILCLNDGNFVNDFDEKSLYFQNYFQEIFPEKSSFEL